MRLLFLIRRLGLHKALNGPPWLLPNPYWDKVVRLLAPRLPNAFHPRPGESARDTRARLRGFIALLKRFHRWAAGRAALPRSLRLAW